MYKGIAGSEGIGIGTVVLIEEHELNIETKRVEETGAEIERFREQAWRTPYIPGRSSAPGGRTGIRQRNYLTLKQWLPLKSVVPLYPLSWP